MKIIISFANIKKEKKEVAAKQGERKLAAANRIITLAIIKLCKYKAFK
jgi:hypothetical protein